MKSIGFVQVNDVIGNNVILPLAIGILWQYAKQDPYVDQTWNLGPIIYKKTDDKTIEQLSECDIVCFSNYVWNAHYHFEIAQKIKQLNPKVFILVGGPSVSQLQKDFWEDKKDIVDLAIVGEGEDSFLELLKTWPNVKNLPGAWTSAGYVDTAPRIEKFDYACSPYLSGFYDAIVHHEQSLGNVIQAVIQTNRGCPYHCTFCEEGKDYKNKLYFYDEQRIRDEIEWCAKNKVEYLSLADDNWGIVERDVEFMRWIRDCKLRYGYPEVVDATYAKNAPERLLQIAQIDAEHETRLIRGITIALQSNNQNTLKSIRRFNLIEHKQLVFLAKLKTLNIPTYTEMIWPLPYETMETFLHGIDSSIELGLDNWLGVYPLSIHPGTQLYEDFHESYTFIKQQNENANRADRKETVNIVNGNRWINREQIIKGQVFYAWLVSLFYFGFGRGDIQSSSGSVCTKTQAMLDRIRSRPHTMLAQFDDRITEWWSDYLDGKDTLDLSMFPGRDTVHWSPYTHLASWLQANLDQFYDELEITNRSGIVKFGEIYPNRPVFDDLYDFSRYYYWWKRKQGWHRLVDR